MLNSAARWLAQTAARFPEWVAVEDEWGTLTWKELEEAVAMGITDGTDPMGLIPRYQAAIMAKRAVQKGKVST